MDYEVAIIGAGLSGLAAGVRLAHFGKKVCIFERHSVYGGLNSFYRLGGRNFDVGLHAVTNYPTGTQKGLALPRVLRQLRLSLKDLQLCPQRYSLSVVGDGQLRFENGLAVLSQQIETHFPSQIGGFRQLVADVAESGYLTVDEQGRSARPMLSQYFSEPVLVEFLLGPLMLYSNPRSDDLDWGVFATMFKSVYQEGLSRPVGGVRTLLKLLIRRYRAGGGKLRTNAGVRAIEVGDDRVRRLILDDGSVVRAPVVISSAGAVETQRLCVGTQRWADPHPAGEISFVEGIFVLDTQAEDLGLDATAVFQGGSDRFDYRRPDDLTGAGAVLLCCPNQFAACRRGLRAWCG